MLPRHFARWVIGTALLTLTAVSCQDELLPPPREDSSPIEPVHSVAVTAAPPGASVSVKVQVPASMRTAPFDVDRSLTVPPNFSIAVYARISKSRFLAVTPDGNLLVSQPSTGKVLLVRPGGSGDPLISSFVTGMRKPHDIVFHTISGTTYVYIAESHQVNRFTYTNGDLTGKGRQIVVAGLPDASTPELNGSYGHELKNIALDGNHKLYVSIASSCNACTSDTEANPVRGSVYQYNADGTGRRLFARGLRNAEGLAFVPGTNTLWVVVNNRDNIAYPFHNDWNGDGSDDYGKVMQSYVNNHPPEEFTRVRDGGNYGWPFCNPNPDTPSGLDNMPFDRDVQLNADGSRLNCDTADRISKGIQAHSAPLGLTFLQNTSFPSAYRDGVAMGLHGSWNRSTKTGYKVAYFPWDGASQLPGGQIDLVTGWATSSSSWGRPVDVAVDPQGNLLVSDDRAGAIYKLTYNPQQAVRSFTLINADTDGPIAGYDPLPDGATLNLAALPTRNLSIRANTSPQTVGSVRFAYDGNTNYRTENYPPYAIAGDRNGGTDYRPWTPSVGNHTLTATPYTGANASGSMGTARTIGFIVTDQKTYEAEAARLAGPVVSSKNSGYTGSGYVNYQRSSGDYTEWTVDASAGNHELTFRYALGSGDRPLEIRANGQVIQSRLSFPATGSWSTWGTVKVTAALNAGSNTVRATATGSSGANVDHLRVSRQP